jgi:hypothetical protein
LRVALLGAFLATVRGNAPGALRRLSYTSNIRRGRRHSNGQSEADW